MACLPRLYNYHTRQPALFLRILRVLECLVVTCEALKDGGGLRLNLSIEIKLTKQRPELNPTSHLPDKHPALRIAWYSYVIDRTDGRHQDAIHESDRCCNTNVGTTGTQVDKRLLRRKHVVCVARP